jgi:hypothetical protein
MKSLLGILFSFLLGIFAPLAQPNPEFVYSLRLKNLAFDCDTVGSNGRIILHERTYIKKYSNTSIDIFAKNTVNPNFSFVSGFLPRNLVSNYTYNNITSMSIMIPNITVRAWKYDFNMDLKNRIIHLSPNIQTTNDMKIIHVYYYYNESRPRSLGCANQLSINSSSLVSNNSTYFINNTNIVTNDTTYNYQEDPYFEFPDRPLSVLPISNTTVGNTTVVTPETEYPLPYIPETNDTISTVVVVDSKSDKFKGTEFTETQFWTLIRGLGGGILFLSLIVRLIKREKRLMTEFMLKNTVSEI